MSAEVKKRKLRSRILLHLAVAILFPLISLAAFADEKEREIKTCPADPARFARLQKKAGRNNAQAQTMIASCYELGRNVAPSRAETIRWLSLAANQGYAPAQYELGRIYLYGRGIPADYERAMLWEKKAALQGYLRAERDLAYIYERGLGVAADPVQAAEWNRKAAEQSDPWAQLHWAQALETGTGVRGDVHAARRWYQKAARNGIGDAQLRLARFYAADHQGSCATSSLFWYRKAAERALAEAMYELAQLYQTSCGPDLEAAFLWFRLGGRFGSIESERQADKLLPSLSERQKSRAEDLIAAWIERHSGAEAEDDD